MARTTTRNLRKELKKAKIERAAAKERRALQFEIVGEKIGMATDPLDLIADGAMGLLKGGQDIAKNLDNYAFAEFEEAEPSQSAEEALASYSNMELFDSPEYRERIWKFLMNEGV